MSDQVAEWRSGRRVIQIGDTVYVDGARSRLYRVRRLADGPGGVEALVFGGRAGHEMFRSFHADRLHRVRPRQHEETA